MGLSYILMKNKGLNIHLEKQHQDGTEYQFGASLHKGIVKIPLDERVQYLPIGELQNMGEEKMDCASRSPVNKLETDFTYLYKNNRLKPENKLWLESNGYIQNDRVLFSDAFIAIKSGTTREGNSLKAPLQAIHEHGLIPKKLMPQLETFEAHHNPERITPQIIYIANEFKERFTIRYKQVPKKHTKTLLNDDMLCTAGYAWSVPINGEYPKSDMPFNHAFLKVQLPETFIFDNYIDSVDEDFIKKLASDYEFFDYDYQIFISDETLPKKKDNWLIDLIKRILCLK